MANFIRGTTPHIRINFKNMQLAEFKSIWVTFSQGCEKFTKTLEDSEIDDDAIIIRLTQEETLKLRSENVSVQVRALTYADEAYASKIFTFPTSAILKDGVIS